MFSFSLSYLCPLKVEKQVIPPPPIPLWWRHTMGCLSPALWKEWKLSKSQQVLNRLTFLASAFEVKMVTREKNIFGYKPKKRTFFLVLALLFSWCWFLIESSLAPLINHIWKWNHFSKFFSSPHPWFQRRWRFLRFISSSLRCIFLAFFVLVEFPLLIKHRQESFLESWDTQSCILFC